MLHTILPTLSLMRRGVEHFPPKKGGWGWVYKSNRSHLRVLFMKHTNIMYIFFLIMVSHLVLSLTVFTSDSDWIRINNMFVTVITKICQLHPGGELRLKPGKRPSILLMYNYRMFL
jgi:hypothetical protein